VQLLDDIKLFNIANAVLINVTDTYFSDEVRKYCEMNSCGMFGENWACPPGVGPVSELQDIALRFNKGLMIQTVHQLESSFDLKGMMAGKKEHEAVLRKILQFAEEKYNLDDTLLLGAGHCDLCDECTYKSGQPCRFPDKALASLEAYGIDVMKLAKDYGIPYYNGVNTVSYVGLILFNEH
jgi:predicted metal-binding protein